MATRYNAVPKQQAFRCVCRGLKPLTLHVFYFDETNRSVDCKPVYTDADWGTATPPASSLGSPLISDSQGILVFDFFFTPTVADAIEALKNQNFSFVGNKKFEVRATGSYASKVVKFTRKRIKHDNKKHKRRRSGPTYVLTADPNTGRLTSPINPYAGNYPALRRD